jgi:ADP-heptose:LPS heptosyltransferase
VFLTGGPAEVPLAKHVARRAGLPESAVLAGRTNLGQLAAAVAAAARVVCGDTGVAHLATALGTPSVVLFGPTSPARWGPPPERPQHRVLWAGRTGDPHARDPDPGLLRIDAARVVRELERISPSVA